MKVLSVIAGVIGVFIGIALMKYVASEVIRPALNPVNHQELEKVFVDSCVKEFNLASGTDYGNTYCNCAIKQLKIAHGDEFLKDKELMNRIATLGYTELERSFMNTCMPDEYEYL